MKVTYTYTTLEAARELKTMHHGDNTFATVEVVVETPAPLDVAPANTYNVEMLKKLLQCFVRNQGNGIIPTIKAVREVTHWGLAESKNFVETVIR